MGWRTQRPIHGLPPPLQTAETGLENVVRPLPVLAVVAAQHCEAYRRRVHPVRAQPRNKHEVAPRLGHLVALVAHHRRMHIEACERPPPRGDLGMGGAALVVREHEIHTPALYVDRRAEVAQSDRRALDVPAGAAPAQRAVPGRLARPLRPPQQRIEWVMLTGTAGITAAFGGKRDHLVVPEVPDLAEPGCLAHREVDVGVETVGRSPCVQRLDESCYVGDGFDRADEVPRRQHVEREHIVAETAGFLLSKIAPVDAFLVCPLKQGVVHVRDVLDVVDLMSGVGKLAVQKVIGEVGGGMPEMGGVVRGDAADVDAGHRARRQRSNLPGRGVVQPNR